jgi:hypothetical protein
MFAESVTTDNHIMPTELHIKSPKVLIHIVQSYSLYFV